MAMLIAIFGVSATIKTPTDIFPNIGIPVVAVVWTHNGLPPDDMSGRVVYYYERTLSAQVNDIEHIEWPRRPSRFGVWLSRVRAKPTR
jgi:multidrug efflux pump subunit AcrB